MSSPCVFCHWNLPPGERQCPRCGRWQPAVSQPQPAEYEPDDDWDQPTAQGFQSGPAYPQGDYERGEPPEYWSYPGRRPPSRDVAVPRPPGRQNSLALKTLIVVLAVAVVGLGGGAIAVALAQGSHSSQGTQGAAAVPTGQTATPASITPTATGASITPTATPTANAPTATPSRAELCAAHSGPAITYQGAPRVPLVYDKLLPDNLPLKPLPPDQVQVGDQVILGDTIGLVVQVNAPSASQIITICKMTLKLVAFTPIAPDPGPNVLNGCDSPYLNPGGPQGGGCGGGYDTNGVAIFTIGSPQVGASMVAAVTGDHNGPGQITPANHDGGIIQALIHVSAPGIYTFSVGLWRDNTSGPTFDSQTASQAALVGHLSHYWGGTPCAAPDMQALLPPPTNPPGQFFCPGAPPQQ